jgi:uncharacterized membrane-anchored protein YjiN (DUF445 family)
MSGVTMNPPAESSESSHKLDILIVGATEERREAILETMHLVIAEHIANTVKTWDTYTGDITVSHLFD